MVIHVRWLPWKKADGNVRPINEEEKKGGEAAEKEKEEEQGRNNWGGGEGGVVLGAEGAIVGGEGIFRKFILCFPV
jgi:hypothetical protein